MLFRSRNCLGTDLWKTLRRLLGPSDAAAKFMHFVTWAMTLALLRRATDHRNQPSRVHNYDFQKNIIRRAWFRKKRLHHKIVKIGSTKSVPKIGENSWVHFLWVLHREPTKTVPTRCGPIFVDPWDLLVCFGTRPQQPRTQSVPQLMLWERDRKSTRLNSSH